MYVQVCMYVCMYEYLFCVCVRVLFFCCCYINDNIDTRFFFFFLSFFAFLRAGMSVSDWPWPAPSTCADFRFCELAAPLGVTSLGVTWDSALGVTWDSVAAGVAPIAGALAKP